MEQSTIDTLWVLICGALVFLMQGGFLCLESGLTRSKNAINVALKNMTDLSVSFLMFWAFGFALMFGASHEGWIGGSHFLLPMGQQDAQQTTIFLFQAMFCATASTIVSGAVAGRMRFAAYVFTAVLVSGFVYPIFGHWAWGGAFEGPSGWLAARGFVDFAGCSVVHCVGGWAALAAILVIGPRIDRFKNGRSTKEAPGSNLPLAMLGTLLLWVGWIGFNGGSTLAMNEQVPGIVGNTFLAGATGMLVALILRWMFLGYAEVNAAINGSLAGLVSITAGCHAVSAPSAVAIGAIAAVVMICCQWILCRLQIDDVIDAVPVHAASGAWGTVAVALFGIPELLGTGLSRWDQFQVQLTGCVAVFSFTFGTMFLLLGLIHQITSLRVTHEQELAGLNVSEHGASTELHGLLTEMEQHHKNADFSTWATVEPDSDVGQIAMQYNRVLERVAHENRNALQTAESAELARKQAEKASEKLAESETRMRSIFETATEGIVTIDSQGIVESFNGAAAEMFGFSVDEVIGQNVSMLMPSPQREEHDDYLKKYLNSGQENIIGIKREIECMRKDGSMFPAELAVSEVNLDGGRWFTGIISDLTLEKNLQCELAQAQKLESVGQLAAGIAHEINTPTQFVGDNTQFLKEAFDEVNGVFSKYEKLLKAAKEGTIDQEILAEVEAAAEEVDVEYLLDEIPQAIDQSLDGVERVAEIVGAMKEFSHPGGDEKVLVDLVRAIQTTITVAHNEWKYVAKIVTNFDSELPEIPCLPGELNQVFLNLIVNAAHAIEEVSNEENAEMGTITIGAHRDDNWVEIYVRDTGAGIPEKIRGRIFDPFFTTKEVGKGTGQGLAIARSVVVDKHNGTIDCHSEPGKGSMFIIRLPIEASDAIKKAEVLG